MSEYNTETLTRFAKLFPGLMRAHGRTELTGKIREDGKQETKSYTRHQSLGAKDFQDHLKGRTSIGRPMLKDDNTVEFGVIDIDVYPLDVSALSKHIHDLDLQLMTCTSKSGGAHLYAHFDKPYQAAEARSVLQNISTALGYEGCEVFPKQTKHSGKKSVGNWINLPYQDAENTLRYCLKNGQKLTLDEYIDFVENSKVTLAELKAHDLIKDMKTPDKRPVDSKLDESDMQTDYAGRNDALFKEGCKLRVRMGWKKELLTSVMHAINESRPVFLHENFKQGPLEGSEIETILRSVFNYDESDLEGIVMMPNEGIDFMNKKYAIVMEAGKTIVIHMEYDESLRRYRLCRSSFADIRNFHKEIVVVPTSGDDDEGAEAKLGNFWLGSSRAVRYSRVVFSPGKDIPGAYNLWRGFQYEPKEGKCDLFWKHLLDNICNGDEALFNYLKCWLARMLQHPGRPAEVAVVLRGGRGVGKSFTIKIIGALLGQHFLHISNSRHLVGNFNAHLQDVVMLFCDEAIYAGDKEGESVMKTLITEDSIFIEPKGKNAFAVPNCLHIVMASNNTWVIPAGLDERRFFVLDVAEHQKQNKAYFAAIAEQMENGGYEALLHELLTMDISEFDFRTAPKTKALAEQKNLSLSPEHSWIYNKLLEGCLSPDDHSWVCSIKKTELQKDYVEACKDMGIPRKSSSVALGMMLKKLFPAIRSIRQSDGLYYVFPPLEDCRKCFELVINDTVDWPDLVTDEDINNTGLNYEDSHLYGQ